MCPSLSVGKITVDPWRGRVEIEAAVRADAAATVRIGKATFAVPRSSGAFGIAAANAWDGNVTFQNVSADIGLWHVEVPSIVISGTQASKSDIADQRQLRSSDVHQCKSHRRLRMMTEIGKDDEAPATLYDHYVVDHFNMSMRWPSARLEMSGAAGSGTAKGRPLRYLLADLVKISQRRKAGLELTPQDNAVMLKGTADLLTAFQLSTEVKNVTYQFVAPQGTLAGKLAKFWVSFGDNGTLREGVEGFALDGAGLHVGLDRLGYSITLGPSMKAVAEATRNISQNPQPSVHDMADAFAKISDIFMAFETATELKELAVKWTFPIIRSMERSMDSRLRSARMRRSIAGLEGFTLEGEGAKCERWPDRIAR
jgi:hypothetical protein